MDKLIEYPQIIKKILIGHAEICDRHSASKKEA